MAADPNDSDFSQDPVKVLRTYHEAAEARTSGTPASVEQARYSQGRRGRPPAPPSWGRLEFRELFGEVMIRQHDPVTLANWISRVAAALVAGKLGMEPFADTILTEAAEFLERDRNRPGKKGLKGKQKPQKRSTGKLRGDSQGFPSDKSGDIRGISSGPVNANAYASEGGNAPASGPARGAGLNGHEADSFLVGAIPSDRGGRRG